MNELPSVSNLAAVDGHFRLLANLRARIRTIHFHQAVLGHTSTSRRHLSEMKYLLSKAENLLYCDTSRPAIRQLTAKLKSYGSVSDHMNKIFSCHITSSGDNDNIIENRYLKNLKAYLEASRVHDFKARMELELIYRQHLGWYPVLNNLTVAEHHYKNVFRQNSRAFEIYIEAFKRKILQNYHSRSLETTCHSYCAVVERGGNTGRLHFHVLHLCKSLPRGSRDPNKGRHTPNYREIAAIKPIWRYGFAVPIAVRFSSSDIYGRDGWRWPVELKGSNYVAVKPSTPAALATYLGKYLTKQKKDEYKWRTRQSQNFGKKIIQEAISLMSTTTIKNHLATVNTWQHLTIGKLTLPRITVQQEATRELLKRLKPNANGTNGSQNNAKSLTENERLNTLKSLITLSPRPTIVEQLRTLMKPNQNLSLLNSGTSVTRNTNETAIFEALTIFEAVLHKYGYNLNDLTGGGTTREY